MVVAANGEVLEAEQLIGGGVHGARTDEELSATVDNQADGARGLADRNALIGVRTGIIPEVEQALVERDRAVTETAALQLIEGGREGRAGISRRATHNGGTAGVHEAARPVVEAADTREFEDAVQALDQASALAAIAGHDAIEIEEIAVVHRQVGVVAVGPEIQRTIEGRPETVAPIMEDGLALLARRAHELQAAEMRERAIGTGGATTVGLDFDTGIIQPDDQAVLEGDGSVATQVVDRARVHDHIPRTGGGESARGLRRAEEDVTAVDDDVTGEGLLVGVQVEISRAVVIQGADFRQLAGRGRIRGIADSERPGAVAAADVEVGWGDAITGDDLVHREGRRNASVIRTVDNTAAEDLQGRRAGDTDHARSERRTALHEHRVGLHRHARVDDKGAREIGAIRQGTLGSRESLGRPVTIVAGIDESELRHVGDELDLILAHNPRREHAIGDGDRRGDRRERILETDARDAGGTAGDLDAFVHAEETPRVVGREDTDEGVITILAADVRSLDQAAELEGGRARGGITAHFEGGSTESRDDADLFGHVVVAVAVERERGRIEADRGAIVPAALAAGAFGLGDRKDARRIIEAEGAVRAELEVGVGDDVTRVVGLDEGTAEAAQSQVTEDLGRSRGQLAAGFEGRVIVHHGGTRVILVLEEDRRTTAVAAGDVIELIDTAVNRADEQVGDIAVVLVGDDVGVAVAAEVEGIAARAEAVGIGGTDAEGGAVIRAAEADEVARAAEEGRAVADLRQIEVLRVDRIQVDRDRARVATEAGGVRRIRQNRVGEVLGAAQAADAEVDGRQREIARDTDESEGAEA